MQLFRGRCIGVAVILQGEIELTGGHMKALAYKLRAKRTSTEIL